jgi:MbtH protein
MPEEADDPRRYMVVVNHEEQYSIWPADRECPPGWRDTGTQGSQADCLAYINRIWTDLRPLSLRRAMDAPAGVPGEAPQRDASADGHPS